MKLTSKKTTIDEVVATSINGNKDITKTGFDLDDNIYYGIIELYIDARNCYNEGK